MGIGVLIINHMIIKSLSPLFFLFLLLSFFSFHITLIYYLFSLSLFYIFLFFTNFSSLPHFFFLLFLTLSLPSFILSLSLTFDLFLSASLLFHFLLFSLCAFSLFLLVLFPITSFFLCDFPCHFYSFFSLSPSPPDSVRSSVFGTQCVILSVLLSLPPLFGGVGWRDEVVVASRRVLCMGLSRSLRLH